MEGFTMQHSRRPGSRCTFVAFLVLCLSQPGRTDSAKQLTAGSSAVAAASADRPSSPRPVAVRGFEGFAVVNGVRLRYMDYQGDRLSSATMVLVPGVAEHANWFDCLIEAGLASRCRVISVDLRGQAKSEAPNSGYTIERFSSDIVTLLRDELHVRGKVIVGGHSLGGAISLNIAVNHPEMVSKLIMLDPPAFPKPGSDAPLIPTIEAFNQRVANARAFLDNLANQPFMEGSMTSTVRSIYLQDLRVEKDGSATWGTKSFAARKSLEQVFLFPWKSAFQRLTKPALLIHATKGFEEGTPPLVGKDQMDEALNSSPRSPIKYLPIEGNHVSILLPKHARQVVNEMHQFISTGNGSK